MNYRNIALAEFDALSNECPDYTVGQLILAVTRRKPENQSLAEWLYNVDDKKLYAEIEKTKEIEVENGIKGIKEKSRD